MHSTVLDVWRSGETDRLAGMLAEDAVFSSPVADYRGREPASHLLGLIAQVLEQVEPGAVWGDGRETVSAFAARVQGECLDGVLREEHNEVGALEHVTLFLRPYSTLRIAIGRMRDLLEESPNPERPA